MKLGWDIETMLDRRLAKFVFTMINNNNDVVKSITRFKLFSPSSVLAEHYRYLLYKYTFSHLDLYRYW